MLDVLLHLEPSWLTTQALIVGVAVGVAVYFLFRKRYKMPPGPMGWPLLGKLLDLTGSGKWFLIFNKWSQHYGPVMTVNVASRKIVVLSKIDAVLEALVKQHADFAGRPTFYTHQMMFDYGSDIVTATYCPRWKLHRKLVSTAIRHYIADGRMMRNLNQSLSMSTALMLKKREFFDPFPFIGLTVFNILYSMCFNQFSSTVEDKTFFFYLNILDTFCKEIGNGFLEDIFPPLRLCPTRKFAMLIGSFQNMHDAIALEVEQHRNTYQRGLSRDFIDSLLLAQEEAKEGEDAAVLSQITDKHLVFTVSNVFLAGIDTSRTTLHWALLAMCLHPDVQEKVQREVDAVIDRDLELDLSMRARLPYTEAVLYEAMRLRPVAAFGVPHVTMRDTSVRDYELPKGTMVMINHHALHLDPEQWEKPEEFRPERFLDASGKMAPKPESWLPFSAGRRVCLGETLARPELHLILAGFMRTMSVELAPGDETDFEPLDNGAFFNAPKRYEIVVRSRN